MFASAEAGEGRGSQGVSAEEEQEGLGVESSEEALSQSAQEATLNIDDMMGSCSRRDEFLEIAPNSPGGLFLTFNSENHPLLLSFGLEFGEVAMLLMFATHEFGRDISVCSGGEDGTPDD